MTKKPTEPKERAAVGRERRLALALRAVLDQNAHDSEEHGTAERDAEGLLAELGYADLESIPKRITRLREQLAIATQNDNGKEIARLGLELDRAKAGLPPSKPKGEKVGAVDA